MCKKIKLILIKIFDFQVFHKIECYCINCFVVCLDNFNDFLQNFAGFGLFASCLRLFKQLKSFDQTAHLPTIKGV